MKNQNFDKDFQDFLNSKEMTPPESLDSSILNYVKSDLNPSHLKVFSKLLVIQGFVGLVTLLFCPQFNLSLTNNHDFFHYLHHTFVENICMAICGSIFIGSGAIFGSYLLNLSEIKKVHQSKLLYYFSISSVSVMTFMLFGAEIYLKTATFWLAGASIAGILSFELNRIFRLRIMAH